MMLIALALACAALWAALVAIVLTLCVNSAEADRPATTDRWLSPKGTPL